MCSEWKNSSSWTSLPVFFPLVGLKKNNFVFLYLYTSKITIKLLPCVCWEYMGSSLFTDSFFYHQIRAHYYTNNTKINIIIMISLRLDVDCLYLRHIYYNYIIYIISPAWHSGKNVDYSVSKNSWFLIILQNTTNGNWRMPENYCWRTFCCFTDFTFCILSCSTRQAVLIINIRASVKCVLARY